MEILDLCAVLIGYAFMVIGGPCLLLICLARILGAAKFDAEFMGCFVEAVRLRARRKP